ncbi:MAG: hypothetical protein ACMUEM_07930 [Flavobacteriales bacterium AspAUS03]
MKNINQGDVVPLDFLIFIIEIKQTLRVKTELFPLYLEEIFNTLYRIVYRYTKPGDRVQELIHADYQ